MSTSWLKRVQAVWASIRATGDTSLTVEGFVNFRVEIGGQVETKQLWCGPKTGC